MPNFIWTDSPESVRRGYVGSVSSFANDMSYVDQQFRNFEPESHIHPHTGCTCASCGLWRRNRQDACPNEFCRTHSEWITAQQLASHIVPARQRIVDMLNNVWDPRPASFSSMYGSSLTSDTSGWTDIARTSTVGYSSW